MPSGGSELQPPREGVQVSCGLGSSCVNWSVKRGSTRHRRHSADMTYVSYAAWAATTRRVVTHNGSKDAGMLSSHRPSLPFILRVGLTSRQNCHVLWTVQQSVVRRRHNVHVDLIRFAVPACREVRAKLDGEMFQPSSVFVSSRWCDWKNDTSSPSSLGCHDSALSLQCTSKRTKASAWQKVDTRLESRNLATTRVPLLVVLNWKLFGPHGRKNQSTCE